MIAKIPKNGRLAGFERNERCFFSFYYSVGFILRCFVRTIALGVVPGNGSQRACTIEEAGLVYRRHCDKYFSRMCRLSIFPFPSFECKNLRSANSGFDESAGY